MTVGQAVVLPLKSSKGYLKTKRLLTEESVSGIIVLRVAPKFRKVLEAVSTEVFSVTLILEW